MKCAVISVLYEIKKKQQITMTKKAGILAGERTKRKQSFGVLPSRMLDLIKAVNGFKEMEITMP